MKRIVASLLIALPLLAVTSPAVADDEAEVGACLRLIATERMPEGLRQVSSDLKTLLLMKESVYSFTLFAGNSYQIHTCAGPNVTDLDTYLYDQAGKLLQAQADVDRSPSLTIKPETTGTYYLVIKLLDTGDAKPGSVGYVQLYE
ncbi:MAG: PPC domain-containing protein [Myxococcota bacterium]|nr:PPC domain-containing protein [Myxococcota bacterium]